ncbi:DNA end-binding protein Ku [Bradyrhizobium sp. Ghvi]|uniref:Ku protein n=1 Tax=Bradyrhizobium sp. Ghvi TaxID=1855319 RepID=UPI0008EC0DD0|nr:Ku protein [Bradyrhizobium sp. Ghvi]SFQ21163.1 DNA end-binding protein Ku [Bradyrhizobium sp. Ghvi]
MADEGASDFDNEDGEQEETVPLPRPQNTRTIQIERFLPAGQIDARYFEKTYYIVPREEISQESFAVIRDAMSREDVVGLARLVLSSRERPVLLKPAGRGLLGVTLRFAQDIRNEADYFSEIPEMKLPSEMMKLTQHIIRTSRPVSILLCWRITTAERSCASCAASRRIAQCSCHRVSHHARTSSTSWTRCAEASSPSFPLSLRAGAAGANGPPQSASRATTKPDDRTPAVASAAPIVAGSIGDTCPKCPPEAD